MEGQFLVAMKRDILYATGFFEIGDKFYDGFHREHTVTDILVCHRIAAGTYKVLYEVDGSGEFVELDVRGFEDDLPKRPAEVNRRNFHLTGNPAKEK